MRLHGWKGMGIGMLSCMALVACDDDNNADKNLHQVDRDFMTQAAYANRAEIEMGNLAETKGTFNAIEIFGATMADEHQNALNDLEEIADDLDYTLPTGLDAEAAAIRDDLNVLTGFAFDSAYIKTQAVAHAEAEALFEAQVQNGKNKQLKNFAENMLHKIRMHKEIADSIQIALHDSVSTLPTGRKVKTLKK